MKEAEEQAQTVHPSTHSRRLAGGPAVPSCSETQHTALSHAGLMEVTLQPFALLAHANALPTGCTTTVSPPAFNATRDTSPAEVPMWTLEEDTEELLSAAQCVFILWCFGVSAVV